MKRILSFLTASLAIVTMMLCCSHCSKDDSGSGNSGKPYIRLNFSEKMVSNSAGSLEVFVSSNTEWTSEPRSKWLSVDRSGGKGDLAVRISFEENGTEKRTGIVRFTADGVNPVEIIITQSALTFTNPITIGGNIATMPDPYIVKDGDYYYTCKASGNGIAISRSMRLTVVNATTKKWSLPYEGPSKPWNIADLWAPELFHIGDRWYVYYAAGRRGQDGITGYGTQRSGVLRSKTDDPLGEWEDMGMLYTGYDYQPGIKPTAANTEYAIDLTTFELKGQRYAVWSGNGTDAVQQIRIATMSDPCTISSSMVILSTQDQRGSRHTRQRREGQALHRLLLQPLVDQELPAGLADARHERRRSDESGRLAEVKQLRLLALRQHEGAGIGRQRTGPLHLHQVARRNRGLDRLPRHALLRRRLGPALPLRPEIHVERRRNPRFRGGSRMGRTAAAALGRNPLKTCPHR